MSRYRIVQMGLDEATSKPVVIYQSEDACPKTVWVRTVESWNEQVVLATGESVDRFVPIDE